MLSRPEIVGKKNRQFIFGMRILVVSPGDGISSTDMIRSSSFISLQIGFLGEMRLKPLNRGVVFEKKVVRLYLYGSTRPMA